jgi:succinyl-CoA synthetase beta subunit
LPLKDADEDDDREQKAKAVGLNYVSMGGNVGCLVNGAGLAMATMDMIKLAGGEPSNFLDVGGGATADQVREGFKIILQDSRVEAILVNIFGGIMKCDVIAQGIIQASREIKLEVPLVARLEGTNVEEGRALLKSSGLSIISCQNIREAAETAVLKAKEYRERHGHSHR